MTRLLPDKFVPERQSVLGQGAVLLALLMNRPLSVAQLFVEARERLPHLKYDSFVETLDALYALNVISPERPPFLSLVSK